MQSTGGTWRSPSASTVPGTGHWSPALRTSPRNHRGCFATSACVKYKEETHPQLRICMDCGLAIEFGERNDVDFWNISDVAFWGMDVPWQDEADQETPSICRFFGQAAVKRAITQRRRSGPLQTPRRCRNT